LSVAGPAEPPRLLLEGRPGSGKTTAVARLVELLRTERLLVTGFLTRELRERGARVGFTIETLDGRRGMLAHVSIRSGPRVGRYGVTHDDLERLAIPALRAHADVVVVDEVGKMELTSGAFRDAVIALLDRPTALVATVPARPDPFTDELKRRRSAEVLQLTRWNRDDMPSELARRLRGDGRRA
jgi:nucleoside-triphosphatase